MNLWPRTLSGRLWENDGRGEACLLQREWESPRGRKGQTPLLRFCNPAMWLGNDSKASEAGFCREEGLVDTGCSLGQRPEVQ